MRKLHWSWNDAGFRALLYQLLAVLTLLLLGWFLWSNAMTNLSTRQIRTGFGFLAQPAGFDIGEGLVNYQPSDSYLWAFLAGLANTLRVSLLGILLATVLGTLVGIGRLSGNFLLRSLCGVYVDVLRNIPVLLQLFLWYFVLTELLPDTQQAFHPLPGVFLSKAGLHFPLPAWGTGQFHWDVPAQNRFTISGGGSMTPEFLAVLMGLSTYTAAYIAEIVRSGIQSVSRGQTEAGKALGLSRAMVLRLVVLPQALRVIIPPLTSQFLNLTKNSSLAVAIGYPDLVSVANTSINQTGQAIECILLIMSVYLTLSLSTSAFMNWYNSHVAIRER